MSEREAPAEVFEQAVQNGEVEAEAAREIMADLEEEKIDLKELEEEFRYEVADILIHSQEERIIQTLGTGKTLRFDKDQCAFRIDSLDENGLLVKIVYPNENTHHPRRYSAQDILIPSLKTNDVPVHDGKRGNKKIEAGGVAGRRIGKEAVLSKDQLKILRKFPDGIEVTGDGFPENLTIDEALAKRKEEDPSP